MNEGEAFNSVSRNQIGTAAAEEAVKPHSKLGIASCITGAAAFLISGALVLIYLSQPNVLLWMLFLALIPILACAVGLILSLTALFFPNRKKFYPILGAGLNVLFLICSFSPWVYFLSGSKIRVL
jgi:hypothetical protein